MTKVPESKLTLELFQYTLLWDDYAQWDSNLVNTVVEVRKSVYLGYKVHPKSSWDEN